MSTEPDIHLLVHAYCDGELDPRNAAEVERRIASDPRLAAERDRIMALRQALQNLPPQTMPAALRSRIDRAIGRRRAWPSWNAIAASILALMLLGGAIWYVLPPRAEAPFLRELTSSHARALIAARVTDVASSDQHTIKPWFSTRTAQAPQVVDLTGKGFVLLGGRLDVIGKIPVPTLVYEHREHVISLTEMPLSATATVSLGSHAIDGFHIVSWSQGDTSYWATSDIAPAELDDFARAFKESAQ